jgi:hypothetical protein
MSERPEGQPVGWHAYGKVCLKRANRDAPCLLCGGCTTCCGCKEKLAKVGSKVEVAAKGKEAKDEPWTCPKCGVATEFEMGHVMVGCEEAKKA